MKPERPLTPREKIEVRLTALLMGELPPEEAAALQARMAAEPELAALHGRLRKAMELLREATALPEQDAPPAPVQLSSERRERLLAHFQKKPAPTPAPASIIKKPRRDWSWAVPLSLAAAVIVVIGGGLMMPVFSTVVIKGRSTAPRQLLVEQEEIRGGPVTVFGPANSRSARRSTEIRTMDRSSVGYSADTPTATTYGSYAMSTPAPQAPLFKLKPALIAANGGSAVAVPPVPLLVTSSLLDSEPAAATPPAIQPSTLNLGEVEVANRGETTANFQLQDRAIPEDQKRPFSYNLNGADSRIPNGSNTFGGGVAVASGTFTMAGNGAAAFEDTITGNTRTKDKEIRREFPLDSGDVFNTVRVDAGGGGLTKAGSGALVLNGSNAYTGSTTINGGTVSVGGSAQTATMDRPNVTFGTAANTAGVDFDAGSGAKAAAKEPLTATFSFGDTKITAPIKDRKDENVFVAGGTIGVGRPLEEKAADPNLGLAETQLLQNEFQRYPGKPAVTPRSEDRVTYAKVAPAPAPRAIPVQADSLKGLTAGNRSGNVAIDPNAIDSLLLPVGGKDQLAAPVAKAPASPPNAAGEPVRSQKEREERIPGAADADARTKQLWIEAQGLYDTGRYNLAKKRTEQILSADPNNQAARKFEEKIDRSLSDYGVASYNETRAKQIAQTDMAWASPIPKSKAVAEIQQNNPNELDFAWLKDAKAPEDTGPLVAQSRDLQQDISKLVQDMIAAAPKNEEIRSLLAKYSHVDKPPAAPAPHSVGSRAPVQVPVQIDKLARTEIAQKAGSNLLRDMAVASLKNKEIRDLLAKHGYTVNQPATLASAVNKSAEEAPDKKNASPAPIPQPEIQTRENSFSTFSLNVSDVSFKLAAASLQQGRMPDPATVRSEEFINAFDYRDPEPAPGVPLAFAAERARYPFAQNRDLLRFSVKTAAAGRQPGRPLNIVLLLDKSGSMERADRVNIVREALRILAAQLQPQDKLSIVTFARTPRLWADGVAGDKAGEMIARVGEITPEGGTNLEAALDLGYATAQRHYAAGSINRVVLFTDGAANLGDVDPDALTKKVEAHRQQGVALDCFGIGWEGYNDDLLEQLTRHGDGRYGFINTPDEAAENFAAQLAGALQVAASDVKVQVEFNPKRVTAYRQIGYAKHQLTKEQFRDNSVAAAQIGAAESGKALYVVEVDPRGEGDLATVRVRFRVPGTSDYREHEWSVPFSGNVPPLEQGSSALRLAGTASAFSEMLAASPYASDVTSDRLLGVLEGVPAIYGADPRPRQLEWMIRQARSLSGR